MSTAVIAPAETEAQSAEIVTADAHGLLYLYTTAGGPVPAFSGTIAVERKGPDDQWVRSSRYFNASTLEIVLPANSGTYRVNRGVLNAEIGIGQDPPTAV